MSYFGLAGAPASWTTAVQLWTLIVAALAVLATLTTAWLLRRTGKGTVEAAKQAAAASERSAQAAEKSAEAAQESVGVSARLASAAERNATVAERSHADDRHDQAADALVLLIQRLLTPPPVPGDHETLRDLLAYSDQLDEWQRSTYDAVARTWKWAEAPQLDLLQSARHELQSDIESVHAALNVIGHCTATADRRTTISMLRQSPDKHISTACRSLEDLAERLQLTSDRTMRVVRTMLR